MSATGHKKFLFDLDFGTDADPRPAAIAQKAKAAEAEAQALEAAVIEEEPEIVVPTFSQEDLDQARAEGFQDGHAEATRDLSSAIEQRLADTLEAINTQVHRLLESYEQDREEHNRDAVAVATIIVRKLFPAMNMDKAIDEIGYMVTEALQRTSGEATMIIRVHPDLKDTVKEKAAELAAMRGQEGAITVMADETVGQGDASVEWEGGGMIRDSQLMWQEIDNVIERNLGGDRFDDPKPQEAELEAAPQAHQEVVEHAPVGDNEEHGVESPTNPAPTAEEQPQNPQETGPSDQEAEAAEDAPSEPDSLSEEAGNALLDEILAEGDEETSEITNDEPENTDM
ncbi:FliH/SctL family protein [Magnetovibrio sp. PR-2]|uniref:FliH/SctL family protein n=1 Tax=Magnetovibrio sp. PR-2 TaxID=3120356 RepID=UPI002FCE02EB